MNRKLFCLAAIISMGNTFLPVMAESNTLLTLPSEVKVTYADNNKLLEAEEKKKSKIEPGDIITFDTSYTVDNDGKMVNVQDKTKTLAVNVKGKTLEEAMKGISKGVPDFQVKSLQVKRGGSILPADTIQPNDKIIFYMKCLYTVNKDGKISINDSTSIEVKDKTLKEASTSISGSAPLKTLGPDPTLENFQVRRGLLLPVDTIQSGDRITANGTSLDVKGKTLVDAKMKDFEVKALQVKPGSRVLSADTIQPNDRITFSLKCSYIVDGNGDLNLIKDTSDVKNKVKVKGKTLEEAKKEISDSAPLKNLGGAVTNLQTLTTIQPEDIITITELATVDPYGSVLIHGELKQVRGWSAVEARCLLSKSQFCSQELQDVKNVRISKKSEKKIDIIIYGSVYNKGAYQAEPGITIGEFLNKNSGGFLLGADLKRIKILHADKTGNKSIQKVWLSQFSEFENDSVENDKVLNEHLNILKQKRWIMPVSLGFFKWRQVKDYIKYFRNPVLLADDLQELEDFLSKNNRLEESTLVEHLRALIRPDFNSTTPPIITPEQVATLNNDRLAFDTDDAYHIQCLMVEENLRSLQKQDARSYFTAYYPLLRAIATEATGIALKTTKLEDGDIVEIPALRALEMAKRAGFTPKEYLYIASPLFPLRDYSLFNRETSIYVDGETATEDKREDEDTIHSGAGKIALEDLSRIAKAKLAEKQEVTTAELTSRTKTNITRQTTKAVTKVPVGMDVLGAIQLAGGYTLQASRNAVYVNRIDPTDFQIKNLGRIRIDTRLDDYKRQLLSHSVSAGDIITVRPILPVREPFLRYPIAGLVRAFDAAANMGSLILAAFILKN